MVILEIDNKLLSDDIIEWLSDVSDKSKAIALRIGYYSLNHGISYDTESDTVLVDMVRDISKHVDDGMDRIISSNTGNSGMSMLLEPIMNRFDHFSNSIEKLTNITAVSNLKGKLGEDIVSQNIARVFPDIELCNVSGHACEGDYHFMSSPPILIEIKTYSRNVPTKEIDKMKRDMRVQGMSGVLLSTTSGITGYRELSWEYVDEYMLVIVPNTGLNINAGVYGIMFMMALQKLNDNMSKDVSRYNIENMLVVIAEDLDKLESSYMKISRVRDSLLEMKISYNRSIESIYNELYEYELDMGQLVRKVRYNFDNELNFISNGGDMFNKGEMEKFIYNLECSDMIKERYNLLVDILCDMGIDMLVDNGEINISKSGKVIARTRRYVKKLELYYYIEVGEQVNFVYGVERMDKNRIVIEVLGENMIVIRNRIK
jgi:hypothetical protein